MKISTIGSDIKPIMYAYAARSYNYTTPRTTRYIEVNIPEFTPTLPKDNFHEVIGLTQKYFVNENYPAVGTTIDMSHCIALPLLRGSTCPVYIEKGTPFLLLTPTSSIEDGYLLYI